MQLDGQAASLDGASERGYAMAALIVAIGVMAVLWSVALPTWRQLAIREREEELVFRGTQYARAIGLYQRRFANASPPSLDVLIDQRFLRTKYKDPMTADGEFQLLYLTPNQPGSSAGQGESQNQAPGSAATQPTGGIIGVASKSTETSLRVYNGRTKYSEWQFIYLATTAQPGGGAQGAAGGCVSHCTRSCHCGTRSAISCCCTACKSALRSRMR